MEKENRTANVYNLIILDESGSMHSIYAQTLSAVNETISGIRNTQTDYPHQRHFVSIVSFEGQGMNGVKLRRDRVPVEKMEDLTEKVPGRNSAGPQETVLQVLLIWCFCLSCSLVTNN